METVIQPDTRHNSKTRLLEAAIDVIRAKGYNATRVEDVCERAGLTKGSFFHHFNSKEELALSAADYWRERTSALFEYAPYHAVPDPLGRVLAYIDFRKALLRGDLPSYTCLMGTLVQETYETHPEIRDACGTVIGEHAATLLADITAAMREHNVRGDWTAQSLALHTQCVIQGAFILAKASGDSTIAAESIDHLRRYIELLFQPAIGKRNKKRKSGGKS